ncbi:uncharacterized protein QC761_112015 [Podospora bellae-mahoneyi]|uniref:Uncharacterized protein n=1 Tax=Podospora bellae-mahoneyi TaxID=2093777 RepID=A0ABR0FYV4_9PEZI|nr:hypothetical protein QC761_112015 [Podospora bellae-mahoneyi]
MRKAWNIRTGRTHTALVEAQAFESGTRVPYLHTPLFPFGAYGLQDLGLEELLYKPARRSLIVPISNQERHQSPHLCKSYSEESRSPPCEPKTQSVISASQKTSNSPLCHLVAPLGCSVSISPLWPSVLALHLCAADPSWGRGDTHTQPTNRAGGVALPFTHPDQPAAQHDILLSPSHLNRLGWVYARSPIQGSIFGSFSIVRRESCDPSREGLRL